MTLDESLESTLNDAAIHDELHAAAYGDDNRPAWIGAYRPATECEGLKRLAAWAATHYDFYLNFVREFVERRSSVLDIGSGCGQNTAMLARYTDHAYGVEPEKSGYGFSKKHNRTSGAVFVNVEFPSLIVRDLGPFDYIFCIETIEHVAYEKQGAFIHGALDLLAPEGRLFITTPNETEASGPHRGIWTPGWLEGITESFGARVVKRGYFSNQRAREGFVESGTHHAWVMR